MNYRKNQGCWQHFASAPFIWAVLIPVIFLDAVLELYHRVCFPLYGLELVSRENYIKIDRHKLEQLSYPDKIGCMYCGYVNGFLAYAVKVASETEKYWCGIKHQKTEGFFEPEHHKEFLEYEKK